MGTETCDIVDYTYSNEWLLRITGDARVHGDRLEKAFHNAAPGAINRTFTGHVYHQSPNLVAGSRGYNNLDEQGDHAWRMEWFHATPCCTGNQARLLPNYIHHSWYGTPDGASPHTCFVSRHLFTSPYKAEQSFPFCWLRPIGGGLAATMYGPTTVTLGNVQIATKTDYPFSDVPTPLDKTLPALIPVGPAHLTVTI